MNRILCILGVIALLAGCQTSLDQVRQSSTEQWDEARSMVMISVGREHLKVGQLDQAREQAALAVQTDPTNLAARVFLSQVLIEQGRYDLAMVELRKVLHEQPRRAGALYLLGVAQERAGRYEDALESYLQAHVADSSGLEAVQAAAEVMTTLGRVAEARKYLDRYVDLSGSHPGIYELAGRLAMMERDYDAAVSYFQTAQGLDPKNAFYQISLGKALFHAGRHPEAIQVYEAIIARKDYTAPAGVYSILGDALTATRQHYKARDAYLKATELNPSNPQVWVDMAKGYIAIGDEKRAVLAARQSLRFAPEDHDAAMLLAFALLRDGQPQRALDFLIQAVPNHPNSSILVCLLGRAYDAVGRGAMAARCYQQALKLDPKNEVARRLLQHRFAGKLSMADGQ